MYDPTDFTPEVMYRALERYIIDRYEDGDGVYDMDVQPLLSQGFGAVAWSDTAGATKSTLHLVYSVN